MDETTVAFLRQRAHQGGVTVETVAARQLRQLALDEAARALAAWDADGAYAEPQTEERESAASGSLLAPRIGAHGFANVMTIEAVVRRRLAARVGVATSEEMEQVSHALRAAQDL